MSDQDDEYEKLRCTGCNTMQPEGDQCEDCGHFILCQQPGCYRGHVRHLDEELCPDCLGEPAPNKHKKIQIGPPKACKAKKAPKAAKKAQAMPPRGGTSRECIKPAVFFVPATGEPWCRDCYRIDYLDTHIRCGHCKTVVEIEDEGKCSACLKDLYCPICEGPLVTLRPDNTVCCDECNFATVYQ